MVVPELAFAKIVAPRKLQSFGAPVQADAVKLSSVRSTVIVANTGELGRGAAFKLCAAGRFIRSARNAFGEVFTRNDASLLFDSALRAVKKSTEALIETIAIMAIKRDDVGDVLNERGRLLFLARDI